MRDRRRDLNGNNKAFITKQCLIALEVFFVLLRHVAQFPARNVITVSFGDFESNPVLIFGFVVINVFFHPDFFHLQCAGLAL